MRNTQPKKNLTFVDLTSRETNGNLVRKSYAQDITFKAPIFPKPIEYADIDNAVNEFVEKELGLTVNGKDVPTFTLYSNQRFSEYSQTWKHTDEDGNLILNFKTLNRKTNPQGGDNQGGLWNIPGDRFYKVLERTVLEDNGTEAYEIYSMRQPYAATLEYRISFVTDLNENLTVFNEMVNNLFKARQFYIRPNEHYIPLILENVDDGSKYSVSDYRFYVQTASIKALGYIIHEEDIKVQKYPKRVNITTDYDRKHKRNKVNIDIEEGVDQLANQTITLTLAFEEYHDKAEFVIDTDFIIQDIERENIRNMRIFVNDTPIYWEKGFSVKNGDRIRIKTNPFDFKDKSKLVFNGINPSYTYIKDEVPVDVSQEPIKHQELEIR